jgi:hypothetical protein
MAFGFAIVTSLAEGNAAKNPCITLVEKSPILVGGRTFDTLAPLTYLYASTTKPKFYSLQQSSGVGPKHGNAIFSQYPG